MENMHKLKDTLCRELDEFARRDSIESYDLDTIHKLTDTIKNLDKIEMLEDGGYSQARGGGNRGGMRTYARDGEGGRYSRDDGRDDMVNRLEEMMSHVSSDRDREEIRRMIERMKGM